MFSGLHIEMATLKVCMGIEIRLTQVVTMVSYSQVLGDWLEDSGWTSAIVQADIAETGTADSFIKASHVTKMRHAHQATAATLQLCCIKYTLSTYLQQKRKSLHWKSGVKCVLRRVSSSVTGTKLWN